MRRAQNDAPEEEAAQSVAGKGRPTPKRREAEARNRRPLVPTDRKAARRAQRTKRNEAYARQQQAMVTGDERYLPARDKGRVRRWVRDSVDARLSPSEYFLPVAMGAIVLLFVTTFWPEAALVGMVAMYGGFIISLLFALFFTFTIKRKMQAKFAESQIPRFTGFYAFTRLFQPRFLRAPKPQVKRGALVE